MKSFNVNCLFEPIDTARLYSTIEDEIVAIASGAKGISSLASLDRWSVDQEIERWLAEAFQVAFDHRVPLALVGRVTTPNEPREGVEVVAFRADDSWRLPAYESFRRAKIKFDGFSWLALLSLFLGYSDDEISAYIQREKALRAGVGCTTVSVLLPKSTLDQFDELGWKCFPQALDLSCVTAFRADAMCIRKNAHALIPQETILARVGLVTLDSPILFGEWPYSTNLWTGSFACTAERLNESLTTTIQRWSGGSWKSE